MHFLGLRKQPKTTVYSEAKSNLKKKKKLPLGCLQPIMYNFFHLKHKKRLKMYFFLDAMNKIKIEPRSGPEDVKKSCKDEGTIYSK